MKKTILAAVPLALLALASPAAAHGGRHADTYTARLAPIAAPRAAAARHERDAEPTGVRGKATMVDGPRRDKVRLHVEGLTAGQAYRWEVREVSGDGACTGETVAEFTYGHLRARPDGGGSARSVS